MRAVWLENQVLSFRKAVPEPEPAEDEALVKVRLAGICGTDLELVKGYYPFSGIPGHEFVGEIVLAPREPQRRGQRVVGEINISCGSCPACQAGHFTHCDKRSVLGIKNHNGAFADYLCLPLKNLIKVPQAISDDAAVFAEPLAAALRIQQQIQIRQPDRVLVVGAGRLGQLIAQTIAATDCELKVAARYKNQKEILAARRIAWVNEDDIRERTFNIVIEASGSAAGFALARRAICPRGTIVLKSTYATKADLPVDFASLVVDEIVLIGSRCGPLAEALGRLENQEVDPTALITRRYSLHQAETAFRHAAEPGVLKILFHIH